MDSKYWYMRLKGDFFSLMQVRQLFADEEINGHAAVDLYFRLCLMSLQTGGVLEFPNGKAIKESHIKSFLGTDFNGDNITKILVRLIDVGLIIIEEEKYKIPEIQDLIGKSSEKADRQRRKRKEERNDISED